MTRGKSRTLVATLAVAALVIVGGVARADLDAGMAKFKAKNYAEAAAEFQAIVDQSPSYDFGYFMIGVSFLQMKKPAEAEENLRKAIELNAERFDYHYNLANAYLMQRNYAKAVAVGKTAEPLATDQTKKYQLFKQRGGAYYALEKWGDAIADLEKAEAIKKDAKVGQQLGMAYYKMDYFGKAMKYLVAAHNANPKDPALALIVANTAVNQAAESKDYSQALDFAKKYRDLKPGDADAHNLLGRAALGAKQYDLAERSFRTVIEKDSSQCYAMANLGKVYSMQDKFSDAETILKRAASCNPKLSVIHENLGYVLQKQKRYDEAIPAYQTAYKMEPKGSIQEAINTCKQNLDINAYNAEQERIKAENEAAIAAEKARQAEEQRKIEEYKRKTEDQ